MKSPRLGNPSSGNVHESVLLHEAVDLLDVESSDTVVDATIGGAGHFKALHSKLGSEGTLVGIDADADAIARAQAYLSGIEKGPDVRLVEGNFRHLSAMLDAAGIDTIDGILFDLGWSSFHLASGRGFSFQSDEPLLMTYGDPTASATAADIINGATEEALADMIFTLGEERFARQIARGIVAARAEERILTTNALVEVVKASTPAWYHHRRINPATKTFQALRIAVNDELGAVRDGLAAALSRVASGGRIAVITFHSIEDRIVKNLLRDAAHEGKGILITRKPIAPSADECARNPRARSAKLRVFEVA